MSVFTCYNPTVFPASAQRGSRSASCRLLPSASPPLSPCLELGRTAVDAGLGLARAHHSSAKQIGRKPRKLARGKGSVVGASADGRQIVATVAPNVAADRCRSNGFYERSHGASRSMLHVEKDLTLGKTG